MTEHDRYYYQERAEAELQMAKRAVGPEARKAHYTLAGHYLDRAGGGGEPTATNLPPLPQQD